MSVPAVHRTIVVVDVEGFSERPNPQQVTIRNALYLALGDAFARCEVPWDDCYHEDRGDGVLVLIPPSVPKDVLAIPVPRELAAALREHNRTCDAQARIRLRVAVHAGEVHHDDHGVAGAAVNLTFRLLAAPALKALLANSPGDLALITSGYFFDEVVRHQPGGSKGFRRIRVSVKATSTRAWVCLPDQPIARPSWRAGRRSRIAIATATAVVIISVGVMAGVALWSRTPDDSALPNPPTTTSAPAPPPADVTRPAPTSEGGHGPDVQQPPAIPRGAPNSDTRRSPPAVPTPAVPPTPSPSPLPSPAPSTPPDVGSDPDPLAGDQAPVQQERVVELSTQRGQDSVDQDWWRQVHDQSGDLLMDQAGLTARLGARLAVVGDSPEPTRDRCGQVKAWTTRVDFASLHVGSQLCAISRAGRYAMLQVRALPGSPGSNGRLIFYGRTWWA